eukprot:Hpha_TRINITY_DN5646_c0_g1::TRINITY_DN5646_c0_g1_i2::g.50731::m.50731/K10392/KIF1; kinesin family member 1
MSLLLFLRMDDAKVPCEVDGAGTVWDLREEAQRVFRLNVPPVLTFGDSLLEDNALPLADTGLGAEAEVGVEQGNHHLTLSVRVRPFNRRERDASGRPSIITGSAKSRTVTITDTQSHVDSAAATPCRTKTFRCDNVLWSHGTEDADGGPHMTQAAVFERIGLPLVDQFMSGYDVCVIAYGQTGGGKTFTMLGEREGELVGLLPRICNEFFQRASPPDTAAAAAPASPAPPCQWVMEMGVIEIYNEEVNDLVTGQRGLKVRDHPDGKTHAVGQVMKRVNSPEEARELVTKCTDRRSVAATMMGATSSRSHLIARLCVHRQRSIEIGGFGGRGKQSVSLLERSSEVLLVDLAGSERVSRTSVSSGHASSSFMSEAQSINISLSSLGNCVAALSKGQKGGKVHVPYRSSKLSFLLKNALGGNCMTHLIAVVSPSELNFDESMSTLRFASRFHDVALARGVRPNENPQLSKISALESQAASLRRKLEGSQGEEGTLSALQKIETEILSLCERRQS